MFRRVNDRVQVVQNVVQFGRFLFVLESKSGFALKGHGCDDAQ